MKIYTNSGIYKLTRMMFMAAIESFRDTFSQIK